MGDKKVAGGGGEKNEEEAFKTFQEKRARDSVILSLSLSPPLFMRFFSRSRKQSKKNTYCSRRPSVYSRPHWGGSPPKKQTEIMKNRGAQTASAATTV